MSVEALFIALIVTVLLILSLHPVAKATGLVDKPGGRKRHIGNVPVTGGIAMFFGIFAGIVLMPGMFAELAPYVLAAGLLVLVGGIDDRFGLPATVRLTAQLASVLILVFGADLLMRDIGDPLWMGTVRLGPFALMASALIYLTVINAFNLIDGLDGLAGSMALIALLSVAIVAEHGSVEQLMSGVIAAAVIGYLVFNLPVGTNRPFRVFMGDSGATLLGLSIVCVTVGVSQGDDRVMSPVNGLWFAALPIYDLLTCFTRRILKGRSPFDSGRDHFHHILRGADMSPRKVAATLIGLQLAYATFGVANAGAGLSESQMFAAWATLGLCQLPLIHFIARAYRYVRQRQIA